MTFRRSRGTFVSAAALLAVLAVAAWARLADVGSVLRSGEVVPLDGDCAYHHRRILYAVEHFPSLPTVDPTMNWPYGGVCPWADGFDLLGAALARTAGGLRSPERAELAAALLPVLLGLLAVFAAMELARLVARRGPAAGRRATGASIAAGLVAALLPQAVASSRFGRTDHHVAEALSMLLLAGWALRRPRSGDPAARALAWEAAGAATAAFACWMFTGGALYVGLAAAIVLVAVLREPRPGWLGSGAPGLLAGAAAAALLSAPAIRAHGRLVSFQLPSLLQPLLVALAGAALAVAVLVARRLPRARVAVRVVAMVAGVAALALACAVACPGAARELASGLQGWLLRHDPWLASVEEFRPPWAGGRGFVGGLTFLLGAPGVAAPAVVLVGGAWAVRRTGARGLAFAALSVATLALTLLQVRFGRVFAFFLAVNTALVLEAGAWLALRSARRPRALALATGAAGLLVVAADPRLLAMTRQPEPRPLPAEAAAGLALRRPAPAAPEDAPGVIAHWGHGHTIALLSQRPVVVNGFGTYLDEPAFWDVAGLASMEPAAFDAWMARRRVGYLVYGAAYVGPGAFAASPRGFLLAPDRMRALPMSPVVIAGSGVPEAGVPHLPHLMPIFASEQITPGLAFALPALWGYERVAGARLVGTSAPGARVVVELPFVERRRPHVYRAWADAGADGRWQAIVPLPTGLARTSLRSSDLAAVRAGAGAALRLSIPEDAVRHGATISVPPLPGPARN